MLCLIRCKKWLVDGATNLLVYFKQYVDVYGSGKYLRRVWSIDIKISTPLIGPARPLLLTPLNKLWHCMRGQCIDLPPDSVPLFIHIAADLPAMANEQSISLRCLWSSHFAQSKLEILRSWQSALRASIFEQQARST